MSAGIQLEFNIDGKDYTCEDRMNIRYTDRFDIWFGSYAEAIDFGLQIKTIKIYKKKYIYLCRKAGSNSSTHDFRRSRHSFPALAWLRFFAQSDSSWW